MKKKILLFATVLISQPAFSANLIAEKIYKKTHSTPLGDPLSSNSYDYAKKCSVYDNGNVVIDFSTEHLKSSKTTKLQITTASLKAMVENVYKEIQPEKAPSTSGVYTNIFYKGKKSAISCSSNGMTDETMRELGVEFAIDQSCIYSREFNGFMYESCGE